MCRIRTMPKRLTVSLPLFPVLCWTRVLCWNEISLLCIKTRLPLHSHLVINNSLLKTPANCGDVCRCRFSDIIVLGYLYKSSTKLKNLSNYLNLSNDLKSCGLNNKEAVVKILPCLVRQLHEMPTEMPDVKRDMWLPFHMCLNSSTEGSTKKIL